MRVRYPASLVVLIPSMLGLLAASSPAQDADLLSQFKKGPHTGPAKDAVALIEVTNFDTGGKPMPVRKANAILIRCDGFVLAPANLFIREKVFRDQRARKAKVYVTLNPGTKEQQRFPAHIPRWLPEGLDYTALKIDGIHKPAAQLFQPDILKPGDRVEVLYCHIDQATGGAEAVERKQAMLGEPSVDSAKRPAGWIEFKEPISDVPAGALVVGPHGQAFGMIAGNSDPATTQGFISFSVLHFAANCVSAQMTAKRLAPVNTADGDSQDKEVGSPMVKVSGGPVVIPSGVLARQLDMEDIPIACVAPFEIDKYEVTNREYLVFWNSLPADRRKANSRLFPLGWATTDPPFPKKLEDVPVLGVRFEGALAYAKWQGKRLPTPYEWCLAAFGPNGEREMPEWVKRYIGERNQAYMALREPHAEYMRANPQEQHGVSFPLFLDDKARNENFPANVEAGAWSKKLVQPAVDVLWNTWKDPQRVIPVGSRDFDVSPSGAVDMVLNASELIVPPPGSPNFRQECYMEVQWTHSFLFGRSSDLNSFPFPHSRCWVELYQPGLGPVSPPLLSRLHSRRRLDLPGLWMRGQILVSSFWDEAEMIRPLNTWNVRMLPGPTQDFDFVTGFNFGGEIIASEMNPLRRRVYPLWAGLPRHFRQEMGRDVPVNPQALQLASPESEERNIAVNEATCTYLIPGGFRCAK